MKMIKVIKMWLRETGLYKETQWVTPRCVG